MMRILQALLLAAAVSTAMAGDNWLTNLEAAKKQAQKENKAILVDFTGSDWCGFCIKLKKEVFDTADFKKFADQNLVLVEIDFPRAKKQTAEEKKANQALQEKYKVEGFPTIIVLDASGKKLDEFVGYGGEGPEKYIAKLQGAVAKKANS